MLLTYSECQPVSQVAGFFFGVRLSLTYNDRYMKLRAWCQTDVGLRRQTNQDFVLLDEALGVFILADGMGGHQGGEVASRMAAETALDVIRKTLQESGSRKIHPRMLLVHAYEQASRRVFDTSQEPSSNLAGMGTTLVIAYYQNGTLYIGNVGDSRAYLYSSGQLWQITEDHSLMNEQLRAGLLKEKDAANFTAKNVITRSVGFEREVQVDVIERELRAGEIVMLCSDGLSGLVEHERITEIFAKHSPEESVSICINEAKKNGGDDNVSVLAIYAEPQAGDSGLTQ
jgi:PPM family protein phosphatase